MVNPVLIIIIVIFFALLVVANVYIMVYFQSVEDKNTAWFPKGVVLLSLTLVEVNILLLPLDVANRSNGGIPMDILWIICYVLTGVLSIGIIPFTIFYYEAEDPTEDNIDQIKTAVLWEFGTLVVFGIIVTVLYFTLGVAQVPVTQLTASWQSPSDYKSCIECKCDPTQFVSYRVSFILYLISILTFIGVFLFILFGGIGMAALPIDLIQGFKYRPRYMTVEQYKQGKMKVSARVNALIEKGNKLKERWASSGGRPRSRRDRATYNEFRADVYLLEEEWTRLDKSYNKGVGPRLLTMIWAWTQLILGMISVVLTLLWIIHIILYEVLRPPPTTFLNAMFIALDNVFGLFGTLAYAIFSFYLLWAVIKGNFKFGLRIPFIFEIHPMKVGDTMMNSFLFNCLMLLLCSMAVVQFCTAAFSQYSRFTGIDEIFNVGVKNLAGIKYIWMYYFWAWIVLIFVAGGFLIAFPGDKKKNKPKKDKSNPYNF